MKRLLTVGMMLVSILLTLSVGVASVERENATNNLTLPESVSHMSMTVNTIQNISLNIILIKNMTEIINIIMHENMTNATEAMIGLQNMSSSPL